MISIRFFVLEILGNADSEGFWSKFHLAEYLIYIDKIRLNDVGLSAVSDHILLDLAHSHNHILQHLFHDYSLLRMNHLVIGLLKFAVHLDVPDIELSIVLEPLQIRPLVGDALLILILLKGHILLMHTPKQITYSFLPFLLVVSCAHRKYI
jgi:hypothetical protein